MEEEKDKPPTYMKYAGLGIQMVATLGIGAWLGYKLDQYLELKFPAFLLTFVFVLFGGLMYQLYRTLNKD